MPAAVLLRRNGLHLELTVDPSTKVGAQHHAGVSDALLESAVSTIVDLEDSVATVDGPDKVGAYRTLARSAHRRAVRQLRQGRRAP